MKPGCLRKFEVRFFCFRICSQHNDLKHLCDAETLVNFQYSRDCLVFHCKLIDMLNKFIYLGMGIVCLRLTFTKQRGAVSE